MFKYFLDEKQKIEHECAIFQQGSDIHILTQRIQELNDRIERMTLLGEPRENSFMKFEFRHNQALQDLAKSLFAFRSNMNRKIYYIHKIFNILIFYLHLISTFTDICKRKKEKPLN